MFEDFMGGPAGLSFQFRSPGDSVTGTIVNMEQVPQTDMESGQPKFFANGQPRLMWTVTLQTRLRDGAGLREYDPSVRDDDGLRTVHLRWKSEEAVKAAVRASGARAPEPGGVLTLTFAKYGQRRGNYETKEYTAHYQPPAPGQGFMGGDSPAAPAQGNHPRTVPYERKVQPLDHSSLRQPSSTLSAIQEQQRAQYPDPPF